jgi:hypothetical protein
MSLATIAALLPIAVMGGIGTRDAALLLIAPVIGLTGAQALAISTLILFIQLVNGVVGFAVWLMQGQATVRGAGQSGDAFAVPQAEPVRTPEDAAPLKAEG